MSQQTAGHPRVYIKTLGCKVNSYDSHELENGFRSHGFSVSPDPEGCQVAIVNTCSVTAKADQQARYLFRRLRRDNPNAILVATGCYAQTDSEELVRAGQLDLVIPNEAKSEIYDVVKTKLTDRSSFPGKLPPSVTAVSKNRQGHFKSSLTTLSAQSDRSRAFIKIQDGCNGFCSYCLIPYARGASRSVAPDMVYSHVKDLLQTGVNEIVFTGIHLGDYGEDLPGYQESTHSFAAILERLFSTEGMVPVRISSLEPGELSQKLLQVLRENRNLVCDHFHLPLQSGSDRILKRMRRTYTTDEYEATVMRLRSLFPHASIGADVIPGFPGETADDHLLTIEFIRRIGLDYLHVFPYSIRPNTAAAKMVDHLEPEVIKERARELRELSDKLSYSNYSKFIGKQLDAIWIEKKDGKWRGLTRNYLNVETRKAMKKGTRSPVLIEGLKAPGLALARPNPPVPFRPLH